MNEMLIKAVISSLECRTRSCAECKRFFDTDDCPDTAVSQEVKNEFVTYLRNALEDDVMIKSISMENLAELFAVKLKG